MSDGLLTLSELAARQGVGRSTVSNWRARYPDFPREVRDGLFSEAEFARWIEGRRAESAGRSTFGETASSARGAKGTGQPLGRVVDILSNDLPPGDARTLVLSLLATRHLDRLTNGGSTPFGSPEDALRAAGDLEESDVVPRGALTGPLAPLLARFPRGRWDSLDPTVRAAADQGAAEEWEQVLARFQDGRSTEARTPEILADFLVELMPESFGSILDPACGLGTILLRAWTRAGSVNRVQGFELNRWAWALCAQRMAMHGVPAAIDNVDAFSIVARDPFGNLSSSWTGDPEQYDVVVADPPYNIRPSTGTAMEDYARTQQVESGRSMDFVWMLAARDLLAPRGTALVVTPMTPTFTMGPASRIRRELLGSGSVEAVIALPQGPVRGSAIALAVWVLRPPGTSTDVLFVNATTVHSGGGGTAPDQEHPSDLTSAARLYQRWRNDPKGFRPVPGVSAVRSPLDVLRNDAVVSPAVWTAVSEDPEKAARGAQEALHRLTASAGSLHQFDDISNPAVSPDQDAPRISLDKLSSEGWISVLRPRHIKRDTLAAAGRYPVVSGVDPDRTPRISGYLDDPPPDATITKPGDVLLSTVGRVRAAVDRDGGLIPGAAVWVIRPRTVDPRTDPHLLALLLSSPRIGEQQVGTSVQRLNHPKHVLVAWPSEPTAEIAGRWARAATELCWAARRVLDDGEDAMTAMAAALDGGARLMSGATRSPRGIDTPPMGPRQHNRENRGTR